jgi:hypothetical protein
MAMAGIISDIDKITGILNMVDRAAARFFFKHVARKVTTYEEAKTKFRQKYSSDDQRFRLMELWPNMLLQ